MSQAGSTGGVTQPDQSDNGSVRSVEMSTGTSAYQRTAPFRYPSSDHGEYSNPGSPEEENSPDDEIVPKPRSRNNWTEDRSVEQDLGTWNVAALIMNKMIGTGIFTAPGLILSLTGSKSISIVLWIVGGIYSMLR